MVEDLNFKINEFSKFYNCLMLDAQKDYVPWFFPCEKNGKNPSAEAILKIDSTSKGSWHHESARLNKEQCIQHIKDGYNIGLSARTNDPLIIIDIDNEKYLDQLSTNTLTTLSRKRIGAHAFCWDKDGSAKINLPTDDGEIRSDNQYVLTPGSYVPFNFSKQKDKEAYDKLPKEVQQNKLLGYYTLKDSFVPRPISFSDLPLFFQEKQKENLEAETKIKQREEKQAYPKQGKYTELFNLKVKDIVGIILKSKRVGHPLHDSDTDANFSLSVDGTIAHCWRHMVSLNAVQYLCVKVGYANCEDAGTPHKERGLSKIMGDKKAYEIAYQEALKLNLIKEYKEKETKKKDDAIYTSLYINEEKGIFAEQVFNSTSSFCIYNPNTGEITYDDKIVVDGLTYKPLVGEEIEKGAILLPGKAEDYLNDEDLDNSIRNFIKKWLDVPDEMLQFALWNIKRSWVYERFHTLNYLRALGDTGMGKTRFLDTLGYIHYKPISTSGATTSAPVFRIIDKWKGTLIIDEADFSKSDESQDIIKIINQGYEKGKFVMRCDKEDNNKISFFDPFCPKILATRKTFQDKATESRCITQVMEGTEKKDIPLNLNKNFWKDTKNLRNKLLMWRFKNYHIINPDKEVQFDFGDLEPRVKQIVTSFISLFSQDQEQLKVFKTFITKHQEELIEERRNSFAGSVVGGIHDLLEGGSLDISAADIIIAGTLTGMKGEALKPRAISSILKSLGFKKMISKRVGEITKRCLPLESNHLTKIFKRYGYDVTVVTVTMPTPQNLTKAKTGSDSEVFKEWKF